MLKIIKTGIFWGGMLCSFFCHGQNVPLGTMPLLFNGSFAGEGEAPRIHSFLDYTNLGYSHPIIGIFTSYDQFVPALGSGVGIFTGFSLSSNSISYRYGGAAIAPKFSYKGKFTISPSLDFRYSSFQSVPLERKFFSSSAGLLINSSRFFFGYSITIFRNAISDGLYQPRRINTSLGFSVFQLGYTFQRSQESKFAFTPQILIVPFMGAFPAKFLMNFKYDKVLWGIGDNGLHVGWQTEKLRIMAFNDVFWRILDDRNYNTTNISFRYVFQ